MISNKRFIEELVRLGMLRYESESCNCNDCELINESESLGEMGEYKREAYYKIATEIIANKIAKAQDEISELKNRKIKENSISRLDKVIKEHGDVDLKKKDIVGYLCPSQFGLEDMNKETNYRCGLVYQCEQCWNTPVEECREDITEYSDVIKKAILEGLVEATDKMLTEQEENIADTDVEKVEYNQEKGITRLEKAVERLKTDTEDVYRYLGRHEVKGKDEIEGLLIYQNCPSDFGIKDNHDTSERGCVASNVEDCTKCWNQPVDEIKVNRNEIQKEAKNPKINDLNSPVPLLCFIGHDLAPAYYCPSCGSVYEYASTECDLCGQKFDKTHIFRVNNIVLNDF